MSNTKIGKLDFKKITDNPIYKKYQFVIVPGLALFLCIIILATVTVPQIFKINNTSGKIKQLKAEQDKLKKKIANIQKINPEEYKKNLETSLIALPPDRDIPSAIADVLNLLSSSGLQMLGITFVQGGAASGLDSLQMKLDVIGDINQLKNFIELSVSTTRLSKIDSIELSSGNAVDKIQGSISLHAFYQPIPKNVNLPLNQQVSLITEEDKKLLDKIKKTSKLNLLQEATSSSVEVGKPDPFN